MQPTTSLYQILQQHARLAAQGPALLAPGGQGVTYDLLWRQVQSLAQQLNELGLGRDDVIALALPNGPEIIAAVLAAAAAAIAAPLNPAYRAGESAAYLQRLQARALLTLPGTAPGAREAAQEQGLPLLQLMPAADGMLQLAGPALGPAAPVAAAAPHDVALLLHTSGATSQPKLAPLTHGNLLHAAQSAARAMQLTAADRCLNVVAQFHIHGLMAGTLAPLLAGGSVVCAPAFNAPHFFNWLRDFEPTWYTAVPAIHRSIVARSTYEQHIPRSLRFIRSSSSPLPSPLMAGLEELFGAAVIEVYGMTETCSQIAANPLPPGRRKPGSVGPAAGPQIGIMAPAAAALLPVGQVGEIVVRGPTVMSGYLRNPQANAAAFSDGWFRTGDLGRLDEDGYLFIEGRLKELIDRGGEKISPFEIDKVLASHPSVEQAVAFGVPHPALGEEIAAVVVPTQPGLTEAELRRYVSQRLADFKTPRRILLRDEIPRNDLGKPPRTALAEMLGLTGEWLTDGGDQELQAPATGVEQTLARLWQEVLQLPTVAANQPFLDLGGNSILAAQLVSRIQQEFRVNVTLVDFFDASTVAAQAAIVQSAQAHGVIEGALLPQPLQAGQTALPASYSQEHLWFLQQLDPHSTVYSLAKAYRLRGHLDAGALQRALEDITMRHDSLRTTLRQEDGQLLQFIQPQPAALSIVDLSHLAPQERLAAATRLAAEDAAKPFDLAQGPLFRAALLRLAHDDHFFLFNMHHAISDGWSINIFRRELSRLYNAYSRGQAPALPALPVQYGGYVLWQRRLLQGQRLEALLAYWQQRLSRFPHTLDLPTDRPRAALQTTAGAARQFALSTTTTEALDALCRALNVTRFMVVAAALNVLFYHYTGQEKILLGVPSANRGQPDLEGVIGFFINTLLLATDLSGNPTARELLARVRQSSFEMFEHQDVPFSHVVEAVQPARDLSRAPLFQVMLVMINFSRDEWDLHGLDVELLKVRAAPAKYDLTLYLFQEETHDTVQFRLEYNSDLFDEATIVRLFGHLETVLAALTADPQRPIAQLSPLSAAERRQLLVEWNDTATAAAPGPSIAALFEAQAARTPAAPALRWQAQGLKYEALSYEALNQQANRLARLLRARGVGPGAFVGVFLERSPELVVSYLAILKAGGAFVPLDPAYPAQRLAMMVEDAAPRLILTNDAFAPRLPQGAGPVLSLDGDAAQIAAHSEANAPLPAADVIYLIYTSGSTGRPKGVLGSQQGLLNRLAWMWQAWPYAAGEVACLKTSPNFVDSIAELFGPLLRGAPALIIADHAVRDPALLVQALAQHGVTRLVLTPSLLAALLDSGMPLAARLPQMRLVVSSGETLSLPLCRRFHEAMPHCRLLNLYGMSEVAADVTCFDTAQLRDTDPAVPLGRPIANTVAYILDAHGNPTPVGVTGELYVGGAGLAHGYHRQPQLTADHFVANPFLQELATDGPDAASPPPRLYRTGDLARYRPDGQIDYIGRRDHQVKLRGHRIELGDIEAALLQHPQVRQAVALLQGAGQDQRLAAFVAAGGPAALDGWELRRFLQNKLPPAMLPAEITVLQQLPLAPGGKVDRRALAQRQRAQTAPAGVAYSAPQTALQAQMAAIWAHVLRLSRVGIHDNFFDLGGHSLLALRLLAQIERRLGLSLPLLALFRAPTVAELAQAVEQGQATTAWSSLAPLQPLGQLPPFFCVHGVTGDVLWFVELARRLQPQRPFYGLQARGLDGQQPPFDNLVAMAAHYLDELRAVQPQGPYLLGGASFGGMVAYEMAQQLAARGETVMRLVLFDFAPANGPAPPWWRPQTALSFARNLPLWLREAGALAPGQLWARARRQARVAALAARRRLGHGRQARSFQAADLLDYADELPAARQRLVESHVRAIRSYQPQPYDGRIYFIRAQSRPLLRPHTPERGWQGLARGGVHLTVTPGSHEGMFREPHVSHLAQALAAILQE